MLARGAMHVHTDLSHDGLWPLVEMAKFLRSHGYHFVCVTEHSEDMDGAKVEDLRRSCLDISSPEFCVIPGIEYSCSSVLHIAGAGCDLLLDITDPAKLARSIREAGGFAVLAHPKRIRWQCSDDLLTAVNAVETWNVRYDGKFMPVPKSLRFFNRAMELNPSLLPSVGLDLHSPRGFYPASMRVDVPRLNRASILASLTAGNYMIDSPIWDLQAGDSVTRAGVAAARVFHAMLDRVRFLRDGIEVWKNNSGTVG